MTSVADAEADVAVGSRLPRVAELGPTACDFRELSMLQLTESFPMESEFPGGLSRLPTHVAHPFGCTLKTAVE